MPTKSETVLITFKILKLVNPKFLNMFNSSFSNRLMKKNIVVIKKIKGNISNRIEGVFRKVKNIGKKNLHLHLLKNLFLQINSK